MRESLLAWDHALSARLTIRRTGFLRRSAQIIAHTGDGIVWIAAGLVLIMLDRLDLALREELTVFTLIVVVAAIKFLFRRRRPTGERGTLYFQMDAHSFPSGHAARTAALAVTFGALNPALGFGLAVWAMLVSLARVALGIHYLLDVAAGTIVGIGVGAIIATVL